MKWNCADCGRVYEDCAVVGKSTAPWGGLGNMARGSPLTINDRTIGHSESLYQALKFTEYPEVQQQILFEPSPMIGKRIAERQPRQRNCLRDDWEDVRIDVMRWVLSVKLAQHWATFGSLLRMTEDRPIVAFTRHRGTGTFWGAAPQKNAKGVLHRHNHLGRLLMELRARILTYEAEDRHDELLRVEAPQIPDCNLVNVESRAIGTVTGGK